MLAADTGVIDVVEGICGRRAGIGERKGVMGDRGFVAEVLLVLVAAVGAGGRIVGFCADSIGCCWPCGSVP